MLRAASGTGSSRIDRKRDFIRSHCCLVLPRDRFLVESKFPDGGGIEIREREIINLFSSQYRHRSFTKRCAMRSRCDRPTRAPASRYGKEHSNLRRLAGVCVTS